MAKSKPFKPPLQKSAAATGKTAASSSRAFSSLILGACVVALVSILLACGAYFTDALGQRKNIETLVKPLARKVEQTLNDVGVETGMSKTAEELLHEGRMHDSLRREVCSDGAGCEATSLSAEVCTTDADLSKRCCLSCHRLTCIDKDPMCPEWSYDQQCIDNPAFMKANCCFSCKPDPEDPCSIDPSRKPDVHKGDITKIFERALDEFPQYPATVHSRDPWLVQFDNVLDDDEVQGIIEAVGGKNGEYIKPSTTAKPVRQANGQVVLTDVPDQIRTSHNAWCQHRSCFKHPVHERVIKRMMDIVGLHPNNAEHMQLLRYGVGEYYRLHHDWIPEQLDARCGPRAFTFFLYLSDVEEGGGTNFPYINKTVYPRKGSAVLWPHGLDSDPRTKDTRTHHEAMPVLKGQKWGANYWIHVDDFKTAMAQGCDGRQGQPRRSKMLTKAGAEARLREDAVQRASNRP